MKRNKKFILIFLIFFNLFMSISLFFTYDPHYDTFESITKDYLKFNGIYFLSMGCWYLLNKLALKIEMKYKDQ